MRSLLYLSSFCLMSLTTVLTQAHAELETIKKHKAAMTAKVIMQIDESDSAGSTDEFTEIMLFEREAIAASNTISELLFSPIFVDGGPLLDGGTKSKFVSQSLSCYGDKIEKCTLALRLLPLTISKLPENGSLSQIESRVYYVRYLLRFSMQYDSLNDSYVIVSPVVVSKNTIQLTTKNGLSLRECLVASTPSRSDPSLCMAPK